MELSTEMIWVLGFLALTIYLFVSEIVRVDVAAVLVMVLLGLTTLFPVGAVDPAAMPSWLPESVRNTLTGLADWLPAPLVEPENLFNGFASNAVISIIAVMIIGAGLDKTGVMSRVAGFIMQVGGSTEKRIIPLISGTAGVISSFMQNVGAAALFLPVVSRISARTGLSMSRLLMPMGFCAILGGTMTMVGSSPLILLNDLILNSNQTLPPDQQMATFNLFDVTPVGIALVTTGIMYFVIAGRFVLPTTPTSGSEGVDTMEYFRSTYGLDGELFELSVGTDSPLSGKTIEQFEAMLGQPVHVIGLAAGRNIRVAPARDIVIHAGDVVALLGPRADIEHLASAQRLRLSTELTVFSEVLVPTHAGISEVVIPPRSSLVGKSLRDVRMRMTYGLNVLAVHRGKQTILEELRDHVLEAGDTLVAYSRWDDLAALEKDRDFVVVTADYPHEELRPHKVAPAIAFFLIALSLILFTDIRLSIALLVGAVGMVLTRVLSIDEAYHAVSWKTVFLLASLIPLGAAVELTGTAAWIAEQTLVVFGDLPTWGMLTVIAALSTFFTLVMSNVGATVLLVPLAVNIALGAGADPRIFALTVALATSNSFLIPTHQVNALIMGPAGYRVVDFMRAGGVMTLLFLFVLIAMLTLFY